MKPAHIIAIVTGIVGAGVGLYFLLRNRLPGLLTEGEREEQPRLQEAEDEITSTPWRSELTPQKLALKSLTPNVVYQNTKDTQLIRDSEGRLERVITHTTVVDNG